jgi:hypothetical protein
MACKRSTVRSRLAPPKFKSPSSRGLGHCPFTAATGVRIPVGTPFFLILHSDHGCQYTTRERQTFLHDLGLVPSTSRRGNFFQLLERECARERLFRKPLQAPRCSIA